MPANPYAIHLGDRNPRDVIAKTAFRIRTLFEALGAAGAERTPAPGKWSARQILCHLADCELVFAFRLRQALAQDRHVIQPFDQDKWASTYAAYDVAAALAAFSAMRDWNLRFLDVLPPGALTKALNHPERGDMTIQTVIDTMAGHDLNHLKQLETIAAQKPS